MLGRLYLVVTPRPGWSLEATLDRTERALAGGVEVVQLRAKDWEARPTLALGERMLALARRYGVPFFLNDRPDLAALLGADGVHLGQNDLTPEEATLGILIGRKDRWGQGCGTEAVRAALDYAFRVLGLRRVKLRTFAHNLRARRAFQKAGFREVGVVPGPRGREDVHMEVRREDLGPEA